METAREIIERLHNENYKKTGEIPLNKEIITDAMEIYAKQQVEICSISDVSVSLLEEAAKLVGNPCTNISGSCDVVCMEWQERYERWRNER